MDQPVKHYSMGMRTRLAFSICAPRRGRHPGRRRGPVGRRRGVQRKCLDWIDNFRKTGTLLFVSHSMAEVRRLCTRAIWIEEGRIREQGDPNDVIRSYHRALLVREGRRPPLLVRKRPVRKHQAGRRGRVTRHGAGEPD